jgi:Ca-activated chloride channel family protein
MKNILPILSNDELHSSIPTDNDAGIGALDTIHGRLPLQALDVQVRIDGLVASTVVTQTFVNSHAEPLEATYIFPLPDRAAATHFHMVVAGRVIEGILKERGQARSDYAKAIESGRRAAITEEERPGVFTLRVGNLMPGETAKIRLTLSGPLICEDGEATFRFPLVVAPRYIPGVPLPGPSVGAGVASDTDAVPDASRISPPVLLSGFPNPVCFSLVVDLHAAGMPVSELRSSLHTTVIEQGQDSWRCCVQPGERLDRDFILHFRVADQSIRTSLILHADVEGDEGTFLLTIVPPAGQGAALQPRDVVFVLDRSGSMGGWKMIAARRALGRMIDTLTAQDRFTVYAFDDKVEAPPDFAGPGLVAATDRQRFCALEFLAGVNARNGTEMAQPLRQAVEQLLIGAPERDRVLVLVTDGQVGNEDQIMRTLAPQIQNLRIFTLGIDRAVNAGFLKRLATLGGGSCELVESEDRLDEVMDKIHRRIATPVLTGLHLEPADLAIDPLSITPARLAGLFAAAPLVLMGRYRGTNLRTIAIKARDAAAQPWSATVAAHSSANTAIASLWARGHVRDLEDRYATGLGDRQALEKEIVRTSLRFGVLCRFTAFVAVDANGIVNQSGTMHQITQPVELAAGWNMGCSIAALAPSRGDESTLESVDSLLQEFDDDAPDEAFLDGPSRAAPPAFAPRQRRKGPESDGSLSRFIWGGGSSQNELPLSAPQDEPDLSAYRRRVMEWRQRLEQAKPADYRAELRFVSIPLLLLVEDLRSIGAPPTEMTPLENLLRDVRAFLARPRSNETELAALWARAVTLLKSFSEARTSGDAKPANKRGAFWK